MLKGVYVTKIEKSLETQFKNPILFLSEKDIV